MSHDFLHTVKQRMKKTVLMLGLLSLALANAQATYRHWPLDSLRARAVANNKTLLMAEQERRVAYYVHKSTGTNYLPKVSVIGTHLFTSRELSLLSDNQKQTLSNIGTGLSSQLPVLTPMAPQLNQVGQGLVDALHTDTRSAGMAAVILTQPIYMGGKIRAYNNITQYAEEAATTMYDKTLQDIIVEVDDAY